MLRCFYGVCKVPLLIVYSVLGFTCQLIIHLMVVFKRLYIFKVQIWHILWFVLVIENLPRVKQPVWIERFFDTTHNFDGIRA